MLLSLLFAFTFVFFPHRRWPRAIISAAFTATHYFAIPLVGAALAYDFLEEIRRREGQRWREFLGLALTSYSILGAAIASSLFELTEFDNPMSRGIIAMALDEGDELISARLTDGSQQIFLGTRDGKAIRFPEEDVRAMGRQAHGVRAMTLRKDDYIVGMAAVEENGWILSVTENGYGKRTVLSEYRVQGRGGQGIINLKTTADKGKVVGIMNVSADSDVMIITQQGKIIRLESKDIRSAGRSTQGVRLLRAEEGDQIASACLIPPSDGNGDEEDDKPPLIQ